MKIHGIEFEITHNPPLDTGFAPLAKFNSEFLRLAKEPVAIALERSGKQAAVYSTYIHGTDEMYAADLSLPFAAMNV